MRHALLLGALVTFAANDSRAGLFPKDSLGSYRGRLEVVDTKYAVNTRVNSTYAIRPNITWFTTARDRIDFRPGGLAWNVNWVSARYKTRSHSVEITGEFRDSSDPNGPAAGTFRYVIRFKRGGVVNVTNYGSYFTGETQTTRFAGRK